MLIFLIFLSFVVYVFFRVLIFRFYFLVSIFPHFFKFPVISCLMPLYISFLVTGTSIFTTFLATLSLAH